MSLMWFRDAGPDIAMRLGRRRSTIVERLAKFLKPYRPYKHYMRGPGPKCREKTGADKRVQ